MTIQPMRAPDEYERTDSRALRVDEVQAQWLQNLGAGVGAAAMTALVAWGVGIDLAGQWRWPIILGGTVFGLGQVVRAFVDEFRAERRWRRRENEHRIEMETIVALSDRLEEERDDARTKYNTLRAEYDRTVNELEATRYRNVASNTSSKHVPIQDTFSNAARADARELVHQWYATGAWPGERTMQWTRSRHSTARDLIQRAGLLPNGTPTTAAQPPESEAWAIAKLEGYLGNAASTASATSSPRRGVNAVNAAGEGYD